MRWTWDQGRMKYLKYESLREIARALMAADKSKTTASPDELSLVPRMTNLTLPDPTHNVWRQYGRLFKMTFLAGEVGDKLRVTEICQRLAGQGDEALTFDEYICFFASRFYYPSPAFSGYQNVGEVQFPIALLIRALVARKLENQDASLSVEEIIRSLARSTLRGDESLDLLMQHRNDQFISDPEVRQVREFLAFICQASFLFWHNGKVHLAVDGRVRQDLELLAESVRPDVDKTLHERLPEESQEILRISSLGVDSHRLWIPDGIEYDAELFPEGSKIRQTHLRVERNSALRSAYFDRLSRSDTLIRCDICRMSGQLVYPWVERIFLEIHHLLPLGSVISVESSGTSFEDIRAVCPNCHRAVHHFYGRWLRDEHRPDFASRDEAHEVYAAAQSEYTEYQA